MAHDGALKQEGISIQQDPKGRRKVVRQDRWDIDSGKAFLQLRDQKLEVLNISPFGCAVLGIAAHLEFFEQMAKSGHTMTVTLVFLGTEVQTLTLRPVRVETQSDSAHCRVAFETAGEPINIEQCKAIETAHEIVEKQRKFTVESADVPTTFKGVIYEMFGWLMNLKAEIDQIERTIPHDDAQRRQECQYTISACISDYLNEMIPKIYASMPDYLRSLSTEQKKRCYDFARASLGPLVFGAPFANRAFFKPLGYAGDFEMMNHLYRNEPVGQSLYDQCMHKYFIDEPAGQAVKNRGEYLFTKIKQLVESTPANTPLRILSVASGPALEQLLFLERLPQHHGRQIDFHCLDQDEVSLKFAQRKLLTAARTLNPSYKFHFHHMAIKNVIGRGIPEPSYDLIYSAGLFDYFSEPVAQHAAGKFVSALKPGGSAIVGNFSKDNPSVPFMEILLDWILIYRSADELKALYAPVCRSCEVEAEPLKINLFAVLRP